MRELLFVRLSSNRADRSCASVFAIALNNTMYQVAFDDERLFKVELGRWIDGDASLFDGSLRNEEYGFEHDLADEEEEAAAAAAALLRNGTADRKRSDAPAPQLSLSSILDGKTGTSGWKKWYEGWSVSSRKNEYLPGGGVDQSGQYWGVPSDRPEEPQYGLNGLNKDGKARDKGLLQRCNGVYKDGTPCSSKHCTSTTTGRRAIPDKGTGRRRLARASSTRWWRRYSTSRWRAPRTSTCSSSSSTFSPARSSARR